jgi:flagellar protein FlaG
LNFKQKIKNNFEKTLKFCIILTIIIVTNLSLKEFVMDGIANVAKHQQTQITTPEAKAPTVPEVNLAQQQPENNGLVQATDTKNDSTKINSKKEVENLVDNLNKAIAPMNTNVKFGVDNDDIFYVSVIDQNTDKIIRRFPAEKAASFLPKMQEVNGILFDSKG